MIHSDLATLLRDDVAVTEPVPSLDVLVPVRLGRQRLRRRRAASGAVALAVMTVGAVVVVPHLGTGRQSHVTDKGPGGLAALMDDHVRPVLERSADDLGTSHFYATDESGTPKPEAVARVFRVGYRSDGGHLFTVTISQPRGVTAQYVPPCPTDPAEQRQNTCTILSQRAASDYTIDRFSPVPLRLMVPPGPPTPSGPYFTHEVVVDRGGWSLVVAETVQAPNLRVARGLFTVPTDDLEEIAEDPALRLELPLGSQTSH